MISLWVFAAIFKGFKIRHSKWISPKIRAEFREIMFDISSFFSKKLVWSKLIGSIVKPRIFAFIGEIRIRTKMRNSMLPRNYPLVTDCYIKFPQKYSKNWKNFSNWKRRNFHTWFEIWIVFCLKKKKSAWTGMIYPDSIWNA